MNIQQAIRFIGLPGLFVCLFFSQSCRKKENPNPPQAPTIGTTTVSNVTYNSAALASAIKTIGLNTTTKSPISEYGFVYGQTDNPTDNKVKAGTATEQPVDFTGQLTGLTPGSKYFVRSYVVYTLENQAETAYGEQATFTTQNLKAPDVSTNDATDLTTNAFSIAGKLTALGTSDVVQTGHVLSATNQTPTLADTKTEMGGSSSVPKEFKSTFTNLQPNTTYYVRAYATNATGTGYGDVKTIKTASFVPPTVTTGNVSNITTSSADVGVTRNTLGTTTNGQVGICWSSTNPNPTTADSKRENGSAAAPEFFSINLANLIPNTTYYVRGYATTTAGTGYGDVKSFKTAVVAILPPTINSVNQPAKNYCSGYLADWASRNIDFTKTFDGYCNVSGYGINDSYGMPPSVIVSFSYIPSNDEIQSIGICVKRPNDGFVLPGTVDVPTINNDKVDNNSKGITWRNNQFTGIFNYVTMTTADVSCLGKRYYSYYFIKPYNNGIVANKLFLTYIYRPYIIGKSGNVYYGEAKTYTILTEDTPYCGTPLVK